MTKKLFFTLLLFLSLSFSYWLNLNKPIEPLKKEIQAIIRYDSKSKETFDFIFWDLYQDKSRDIKFRLKMLHLFLFVNKD